MSSLSEDPTYNKTSAIISPKEIKNDKKKKQKDSNSQSKN
jgi:hypothetical protein